MSLPALASDRPVRHRAGGIAGRQRHPIKPTMTAHAEHPRPEMWAPGVMGLLGVAVMPVLLGSIMERAFLFC